MLEPAGVRWGFSGVNTDKPIGFADAESTQFLSGSVDVLRRDAEYRVLELGLIFPCGLTLSRPAVAEVFLEFGLLCEVVWGRMWRTVADIYAEGGIALQRIADCDKISVSDDCKMRLPKFEKVWIGWLAIGDCIVDR